MNEEKDIFDLFRQNSDALEEKPSAEAWQRLETRLASRRKPAKPSRRPMQLQIVATAVAVTLILAVGAASWLVTARHEERLRARQAFDSLQFLAGEWFFSDGKTHDVWTCQSLDSLQMAGEKKVYFEDTLLSKTNFTLKNQQAQNIFNFNGEAFLLMEKRNDTYFFKSKKGKTMRLRRSADHRFTLSFDDGIVFAFKRHTP